MSSEQLRQYFTQNPDRNLYDTAVPEYFDAGRQPTRDKTTPGVAEVEAAERPDVC